MLAVLEVVSLLQSCKVENEVSPDELEAAIKKHLDCFISAYGEAEIRPKHHYSMHLPDMLRRFGVLVSTFTHERKHRAVKRYSRVRTSSQSFDVAVLEDVTAHNIWELTQKHWHAFSTSTPSVQQTWWLTEMFQEGPFTLHHEVRMHGGISTGDIVCFEFDNQLEVGELFLNVGCSDASMYSVVSLWEQSDGDPNLSSLVFKVQDEQITKIHTTTLVTSLTCRMSDDRASCTVLIPHLLRTIFQR